MSASRPLVLLVQLPIPPPGFVPVRGNVPLAAGYLKLFARRRGLEQRYRIDVLPASLANTLGDQGLVQAILQREPWLVGFTCYVWNVDRTLWLAEQLKRRRPDLIVLLGGPELTIDNRWVLEHPAADYAAIGEGEQTLAELLSSLPADGGDRSATGEIPGLWQRRAGRDPLVRQPLDAFDEISSPYLEGILDATEEQTMLLETTRGCRFQCKFCYYPKSYQRPCFLSLQKLRTNLDHAARCGVQEVFLLDPTLNQRPDFPDFLQRLRAGNPNRLFTYSAELRAEGIRPETARLLREANFAEVEVGLQSVDPQAQSLINRRVDLDSFSRGVEAMLAEGIHVQVDLILGLPGDTVDTVRRGLDYVQRLGASTKVQVFPLAVLPGTALRAEARQLGLHYQARPPYHVLETPTLSLENLVDLAEEAQQRFGVEFDPLPPPSLEPHAEPERHPVGGVRIDLECPPWTLPAPEQRAQSFSLWLRSNDFHGRRKEAAELVAQLVADCPHGTLQVIVEATDGAKQLFEAALPAIQRACFQSTSYLDRYYSLGSRPLAAKRIVLLMPCAQRSSLGHEWIAAAGQYGCILWSGGPRSVGDLEEHEYLQNPSSLSQFG